ncbi:MAG: hypothetical protein AB4352_23850 [Hormoscilla sp.]
MTAQMDDIFQYRGIEYSLAGISEGELFDPAIFELKPTGPSSACWRGYIAVFAISNSHLVLDTLYVHLLEDEKSFQRKQGPVIKGITPTDAREEFHFNNHYKGLNYHLEYSGGLLIADGFIRELYVHMGFHSPWKYKNVIELIFTNGILQNVFDRSEQMANIRQMIVESNDRNRDLRPSPSYDEIRNFVERAFDRSYNM